MIPIVLFPSVAPLQECERLIHFGRENIQGLARENVAGAHSFSLIQYGDMPVWAQAVMGITSARIRVMLERLLWVNLYADSIQLKRWLPGESLGWHADNAYPDGKPNYVPHRIASAVVYLTTADPKDGGATEFRSGALILPRAGLGLAFGSGLEHVHRVRTVNTERWTMPMWFTTDKDKALSFAREA